MEKSSDLKTKLQENVGPTSKWQKKIADYEKFKCEIKYIIQSYHPNIIKLYEVFEDTRYFYLVMEECSGEELFDRIYNRISENSLYKEREAAIIFKQIMSAVYIVILLKFAIEILSLKIYYF